MRNSIALLPGASTTRGAVTSLHCRVARGAQSLADDCITTYLKAASQAQKATKQAIRNRKQNLDRKVSAELSSKGTVRRCSQAREGSGGS